jgi:hypothetical protein
VEGLISKATLLAIVLILIAGTINLGEELAFASNSEEGGEEGGSNGDVEDGGTTEGDADEEGTEAPPNTEVSDDNDDADTGGVESEQESACPAVAFEGPSYTDENGCPAPCPPPAAAQGANVPEGCPQPIEEQIQPSTQSPEEQTLLPADTATPPPGQQQAPPDVQQTGDPETQLEPGPEEQVDTDTDGDGLLGSADNCPFASNPDQKDTNVDGEGDACDPATIGGSAEICEDGIDNDNDGELDENVCIISSLDGDGDEIPNGSDNCPFASNPDQKDTDGDGVGDACPELGPPVQIDTDTDGDGLLGSADNCPSYHNPVQTDTDGDGEGDVCDPVAEENTAENCRDGIDNDGDGIADGHDTGCNQVLYEPYEVTCDDGIDNDADTLIDMQDPDDCEDDTEEYGGGVPGEPPFRAPK